MTGTVFWVFLLMPVQAVLQYHPGLEFLADTPEFQARYAETVIYRIFYTINRCDSRQHSTAAAAWVAQEAAAGQHSCVEQSSCSSKVD